jgi:HNH endonuclease
MAKATPRRPTAEERFWAKVDKNGPIPEYRPELGPCWPWTGAKTDRGYGETWDGRVLYAHRFAYELLVGPIPDGLEPDHLCRVRHCVKAIADQHGPAHLEVVTHRENLLRGESPAAQQARRTHCPQGHPYDAENTSRWNGHRYCLACRRERDRQRNRSEKRKDRSG